MSAARPVFRLLDSLVGWDPRPGDGLTGVTLEDGTLRLAPAHVTPAPAGGGAAMPGRAASSTRPAIVARDAGGVWWLGGDRGLARLGPGDTRFRGQGRRGLLDLVIRERALALVRVNGLVEALDTITGRLTAEARVPDATRVELRGDGSLDVTDRWGRHTILDAGGLLCSSDPPCGPGRPMPPHPATGRDLPPGVTAGLDGFHLPGRGFFDWRGRPRPDAADNGDSGTDQGERQGQYLSAALDSGIPGCRWHRIRLDVETPGASTIEVAFATTDGPPHDRTPADPIAGPWHDLPTGDPNPADWHTLPAGAWDCTLNTAPGRYGYVRLRLTSAAVVHRVRLDLPRATSLGYLPAVYSDDPEARDFTERFLSIVDAALEEIDEVIARRPALLDARALPDDALGWLAGLLGTGFEAEMTADRRRDLLRAAPDLFRRRGTPSGLADTLRIALGVDCTIEELGAARPWGAVGRARLGSVRLFSRSAARVRLGTSRLGRSVLEGRGNPDLDAVLSGAHRIRVHVPAGADLALVSRVVRSQIPAHLVFTVHPAGRGLIAGTMRLGIDTVLTPPATAVVGDTVLGRRGVLAAGRNAGAALVVGRARVTAAAFDERMERTTC